MQGGRPLGATLAVFAGGLVAAVVGMNRYDDAYAWVAHTSDVRIVIGRAIGHTGHAPSCDGLRRDADDLARLTADNEAQQARVPALRASVDDVCAGRAAPSLIGQLAELDATERALMDARRERLADVRRWTLAAFIFSTLGAILAVSFAFVLQRRAHRALVDSEENFRLMASSARDIMRIHDAAGRPTYVSPSIAQLGYTPEEVLAAVPLSLGHPDDLARMQQTLREIQETNAPASTLVYRLRAKDGTYRWFETHSNPVRDRAGKLLRFYTSARDVTERIELQQELEAAAVTDELTGLLNRRGFQLIAGQEHRIAMRQKQGLAVIFADLDGLKGINDRFGHDHGDRAIRRLGEILRETFRESDVVARLGGDEFAALAYNVDRAALERIVERVRATVEDASLVGDVPLAVSLGTAVLEPGQAVPLDELLAQADRSMYEQKRARRSEA